ncbi:hypothetical protein WME73_11850 [Sorangium sp. So ce302]
MSGYGPPAADAEDPGVFDAYMVKPISMERLGQLISGAGGPAGGGAGAR